MRKIFLNKFFLILYITLFFSCAKDTGNYTYHEINKVDIADFQTTAGYQVLFGEVLTINPKLMMTEDQSPVETNYIYQWSLRLGTSLTQLRDSVLSEEKNLKVKIGLTPGSYSLQYRVTDKNTGVQFQKRTTLLVTTDVYEGYMVLSEVNGQSRLDMLSYKSASNTFVQYTDVLAKLGSTLPIMQGKPYQVLCMQYTNPNITTQNYGIFVLTSTGASRINQETFAYDSKYDIRYLFLGNVPTNLAPLHITGEFSRGSYPLMYAFDNNNVYSYSALDGYSFKYTPLNSYSASGSPFKVSPFIVTNGAAAVFFNLDKRSFVTAADYNSTSLTDVPLSYNYPTGYELIFMGKDYNDKAFAVLKDPATLKYFVMNFKIGSAQTSLQEVLVPGFENATNFVLNPDWGYLFYSIGGKVYEYDLALNQSKVMVDKGMGTVSYLDFQHFFNRTAKTNPNYPAWSGLLTVASYDPSGPSGNNGTMELYSVPQVNGQIMKTNSWKGFGKIVSVSYRER